MWHLRILEFPAKFCNSNTKARQTQNSPVSDVSDNNSEWHTFKQDDVAEFFVVKMVCGLQYTQTNVHVHQEVGANANIE